MVQTRSQIKSKGVRAPAIQGATKTTNKTKRREVTDDTPIIIDLDTKLDLDTQLQNAVVTQQYDPTEPGVRQTPSSRGNYYRNV